MDYQTQLRRAGVALITLGAIDIVYMLYCMLQGLSYTSSFNLLAVLIGVLLMRGGLRTARFAVPVLAFFATVLLIGGVGSALSIPVAVLKLSGAEFLAATGVLTLTIAVLWFAHQCLKAESVLRAQEVAGVKHARSKSAVIAGTVVAALLVSLIWYLPRSAPAEQAVALAQAQLGPGFEVYVESIALSSQENEAQLLAIKGEDVQRITVRW